MQIHKFDNTTLVTAKNLDYLRTVPDNTYDCIITDAPYGLSFMGHGWDYDVPSLEFWKEVYRVLKPGGYVLCFSGTRTYHRAVINIEDAGFEIRDCIQWIYGEGMPKSHNVSMAMDKHFGVKPIDTGLVNNLPNIKGNAYNSTDAKSRERLIRPVYKPASPMAQKYEGFGTNLKPANEPICVARKPLAGTTVKTILKYGTGALNIDAGRIPLDGETPPTGSAKRIYKANAYNTEPEYLSNTTTSEKGRWPANVILDEYAAALMDEQSGSLKSGAPGGYRTGLNNKVYNPVSGGQAVTGYGDTGGASRFFYVAKASRDERNYGLEQKYMKSALQHGATMRELENMDWSEINPNPHPTVKPVKLMRYLCRIFCPPGGHICEPYNGSGTTGIAAKLEGFVYTGIDDVEQHIIISIDRINGWDVEAPDNSEQLNLFA